MPLSKQKTKEISWLKLWLLFIYKCFHFYFRNSYYFYNLILKRSKPIVFRKPKLKIFNKKIRICYTSMSVEPCKFFPFEILKKQMTNRKKRVY